MLVFPQRDDAPAKNIEVQTTRGSPFDRMRPRLDPVMRSRPSYTLHLGGSSRSATSLSVLRDSCITAVDMRLRPATVPPENLTLSTCGRMNPVAARSMAWTGREGDAEWSAALGRVRRESFTGETEAQKGSGEVPDCQSVKIIAEREATMYVVRDGKWL